MKSRIIRRLYQALYMKDRHNAVRMAPLFIFLLMSYLCSLAAEEILFETISLQHASVDEVIPIVKSLVSSDIKITGKNQKIFVRATPSQLAKLRNLISELDTLRKSLLITVRRITHPIQDEYTQDLSANNNMFENIQSNSRKHEIRRYSTKKQDTSTYQLSTLEGDTAFISLAQLSSHKEWRYYTIGGLNSFERIEKHDWITNGFHIIPRLKDNWIEIDIFLHQQRMSQSLEPGLEHERIKTTISGQIGQWMDLAVVSHNRGVKNPEKRSLYTHSNARQNNFIIQIKVELKH